MAAVCITISSRRMGPYGYSVQFDDDLPLDERRKVLNLALQQAADAVEAHYAPPRSDAVLEAIAEIEAALRRRP